MTRPPGTVHALHGFIGSGKSTLARRLEVSCGAVRFTPDAWTHAMLGASPSEEIYRPALTALYELFEAQWTRTAGLGVDVVLDYGFWQRAERDRLRAVCAAQGLPLRFYDLGQPVETLWQRVTKRNALVQAGADTESVWIHEHDFHAFYARFEPLSDDEERVTSGGVP